MGFLDGHETQTRTEGQENVATTDMEPDWAERAEYYDHKPNWVDRIPHPLWELGEVFFPIPRKKKGHNYPHHMQEYRYTADSETLNAYLEAGSGYGIACAGELAVVDIDDKEYLPDIVARLPKTAWQMSGSREGYHLFYYVPGLDTRQMLHIQKDGEWHHIGEVKCDPHGYVVGPGSVHPSGNRYGPLNGDKIASVSKEELLDAIEDFQKPEPELEKVDKHYRDESDIEDKGIPRFYELSADDVLPGLEPENRIAHPIHGSTTGKNFMKNEGGDTFTCWRCQYGKGDGCGLNGAQYLAVEATNMDCEDVRRYWRKDSVIHYKAWKRAVDKGLLEASNPPYRVAHGFAVKEDFIGRDEKLAGKLYFNILRLLRFLNRDEEFDTERE